MSFHVAVTNLVFFGRSTVAVPPKLLAILLSVHDGIDPSTKSVRRICSFFHRLLNLAKIPTINKALNWETIRSIALCIVIRPIVTDKRFPIVSPIKTPINSCIIICVFDYTTIIVRCQPKLHLLRHL